MQELRSRAARALARSELDTLRVPEDLEHLHQLGFPERTREALRELVELGLLTPVARGLYEVRDSTGLARGGFEKLLAARLAGAEHLVTGWWALARAGLTDQDVREVIVLIGSGRRRPLTLVGRRVRFVTVAPAQIWGGRRTRSGLRIARPERALCDCAGRQATRIPASRIAEALDAFLDSTTDGVDLLRDALKRFDSGAASRRLGYLAEVVSGRPLPQLRELTRGLKRADPLDRGDEHAPLIPDWRLRSSRSRRELLEHRRVS